MVKFHGNKKVKHIIALIVVVPIFTFVVNAQLYFSKTSLEKIIFNDIDVPDGICVTVISQKSVDTQYFRDSETVEKVLLASKKTVCKCEKKYRYEVFSGSIQYEISFYQESKGKYIKLSECSIGKGGEVYHDSHQYAIDEDAPIFATLNEIMRG